MSSKLFRYILIAAVAMTMILAYGTGVVSHAAECAGGDHDYTVTIEKQAGENTDGQRKFVCKDCGHTYTQKIERTGHIWSKWKVNKKTTCTKAGEETRKCNKHSGLKHKETRAIKATGHDWGPWITDRKATAGKDGLQHRVCKNNSGERQTRTTSALGERSGVSRNVFTTGRTTGNNTGTQTSKREESDTEQQDNVTSNETENRETRSEESSSDVEAGDPAAGGGSSGSGNGAESGTSSGEGTETESEGQTVEPFGTADAVLLGANGAATIFWVVLLLPLIRVMFWIAAKRREKEEEEGAA